MRRLVGAVLLAACATRNAPAPASQSRIVIDGDLADWSSIPATSAKSQGELRSLRQLSDGRYIYLQLDFDRAVSLLALPGTLSLGFDTDSMPGIDMTVDLSLGSRAGADTRIAGRTADAMASGLVFMPTTASQRFEIRLTRGTMFAHGSYRASAVLRDVSGAIQDSLPTFSATLAPLDTTRRFAESDPLTRAPGTQFRALQWNVANEGIAQRGEYFRHVIDAVHPDLLILDEVGGSIGADGVGRFLESLGSGPWNFTYGGGGGYQRTVIASHSPVTEVPELRFIPFPDSMVAQWWPRLADRDSARERASIKAGVATGGAIVTIGGKRLAVFGVDLQSAGNPADSWQELRRRAESRIVRERAAEAIRAQGPVDGVIAGGDFNLVSTRVPLEIIQSLGNAFDGKPLTAAYSPRVDGATTATWEAPGQFPPGRLDWVNYSASSLQALRAFTFDADDLAPKWRAAHQVRAVDSDSSSDHRPIVVDFRWR